MDFQFSGNNGNMMGRCIEMTCSCMWFHVFFLLFFLEPEEDYDLWLWLILEIFSLLSVSGRLHEPGHNDIERKHNKYHWIICTGMVRNNTALVVVGLKDRFIIISKIITYRLHDPKKVLKVEFHRVPYNQTFDFVTGQFVKILSPTCSWKMSITLNR